MNKSNLIRLRHILDSIGKIEGFARDISEEDFLKDEKTCSAVLYQLENIGEAVNNLSDDFRAMHLGIPYDEIVGLRNVIVHEYFYAYDQFPGRSRWSSSRASAFVGSSSKTSSASSRAFPFRPFSA